MVNAQEWLDGEYPKENRKEITELNISGKDLEGNLDLSEFVNLEKLYCQDNFLTNLSLVNNLQLKVLNVDNNNFSQQDLSFVNHLINLKKLRVGNIHSQWNIQRNIYNRFIGSFEQLKNLNNLKDLEIANTDIDGGVEYLPSSIENISYSTSLKPDSKIEKIAWQLELFSNRELKKNEKH